MLSQILKISFLGTVNIHSFVHTKADMPIDKQAKKMLLQNKDEYKFSQREFFFLILKIFKKGEIQQKKTKELFIHTKNLAESWENYAEWGKKAKPVQTSQRDTPYEQNEG